MALKDWISPQYLDRGVIEEMRMTFAQGNQILLPGFLRQEAYENAMRIMGKAKFKRAYIPDQMSCAFAMKSDSFLKFLASKELQNHIMSITGTPSGKKAFYTQFGSSDYTILNDMPKDWKLVCHYFMSPYTEGWGGRIIWREPDGSHRYVHPDRNTLCITKVEKHLRGYVEYVNHHIGKKKLICANV